MIQVSLPAVASLLAGLGCLYLGWLTWQQRDRPAAWAWLGVIGTFSLWALAYGAGLLVHDPQLRRLFEYPIWVATPFTAFFLFTFGLEYSGRGHLVRSWWTVLHAGIWIVATLLYWTNPVHHLMWTDYAIDPTLGAATVTYTRQPVLFAAHGLAYVVISAMILMLIDTVINYGNVYKRQTAALIFGIGLPVICNISHLFKIGPFPYLDLTPIAFFPFAVCGMYALFQRNMFELSPATMRTGERAAIDDLGSAVVVVDERGRIITYNDAAEQLLGTATGDIFLEPLADLLEVEIDVEAEEQTVPIQTDFGRWTFAVTTSPFADAGGTHVGHTVIFQDVTAENRRKQRLEVQNRILRHNLRNDLNVIKGWATELRERTDDEDDDGVRSIAETIERKTDGLQKLGRKASEVEAVFTETELDQRPVVLEDLLSAVRESLSERYPNGEVIIDVPGDLRIRSNPQVLELVLENLTENGLEHTDTDIPRVRVALANIDHETDVATVEVSDNGSGIPDHEITVIERGRETALEHGSGLGLWVVSWGVKTLGGSVKFDVDGDGEGTTVTIDIPGVVSPAN